MAHHALGLIKGIWNPGLDDYFAVTVSVKIAPELALGSDIPL